MKLREKILNDVQFVSSLPPSATKIMQLLHDPDVEISEIAKNVEFDPGLTANILRFANSALFGGVRLVKSVKESIVKLGMNQILQLVMMSAIAPIASKPIRGYDLPPGELWTHSIAAAIGIEQLAETLNIKLPDYAFTAGLLHDIGKIVLGTFVEVDTKPIMDFMQENEVSFDLAEQHILGIDHAEVGAALLEMWNIPTNIVEVSRWHHRPEEFSGDRLGIDLVHMSDAICLMFGIGTGKDGLHYRLSQEVASRLNVKYNTTETVACRTMSILDDMQELLTNNQKKK